jgi:hypothetical protein
MGSRVVERIWNILELIIANEIEVLRKEPIPVSLLTKQNPNKVLWFEVQTCVAMSRQ